MDLDNSEMGLTDELAGMPKIERMVKFEKSVSSEEENHLIRMLVYKYRYHTL